MNQTAEPLLVIARANPWWQFTGEEIREMMNLSKQTVAMLVRSDDSPFVAGKSRPERVEAVFAAHPGWKPTSEE
jgi:DNA-binding IclR family transcriptional regulator